MIPHFCKTWLACLIVLAAVTAFPPHAIADSPAPPPTRIVAVGDLHGDHDAWRAIARAAGVVDGRGRWAGGAMILVQTGDIVDRGADSLKIIRDLQRLEREAKRAGGRVVVLVGNHEAMMVTGDLRYVHPGEYAAFADRESPGRRDAYYEANRAAIELAYRARDASASPATIRSRWMEVTPLGKIEHELAWRPTGELGRWVIARPAVVMIGGSLFVHAGLSPAYAALPIDEINRRVAAALVAREADPQSIVNDEFGPLWYRGLAGRAVEKPAIPAPRGTLPAATLPTIDEQLANILAVTGARRIVIGHTPLMSGVAVTHGGRLVRIDSGISRAYGGIPGYVEIIGDRVTAHNVARPAPGGAQ